MADRTISKKQRDAAPQPPAAERGVPDPHEAQRIDEQLSEMELALTVLWNGVRRWMSQRSKVSDVSGLSDLDVFVLHLLVYRNRPLRMTDLAFALAIDDLHQVTYSLKKLVRLDMITSARSGKEVFYTTGDKGRRHYDDFIHDRQKYLEPSIHLLAHGETSFETMTSFLRTLSGVYEQAARSAASSKGL